tara:strand:+ start:198736 stop:199956 length:1221 start_codon:yes stop_codon:yes gene_type:complete
MLSFNARNTHLKKIASSENSLILETDQFADGLQFFSDSKSVLGLMDLDNTVLSYRHTLGTDHWFDFDFREFMEAGASGTDALKQVLPFYLEVVPKIHPDDVYAVEPETPQHIIDLHKQGFNVLALTSRGEYLQNETMEQLARFDINFNQGHFQNRQQRFPFGDESVLYNGVILAGGKDKGDCLLACLDEKSLPETVVMYDDKLSNLQKVQRAIEKLNAKKLENDSSFKPINFIGIRYSRLDHKIQNVDDKIVALQKKYFSRVLSDSDAGAIIKAQAKKDRSIHVKLEYDEIVGCLNLYSHKASLTSLLQDIIPGLEEHRIMGKVIDIHGKKKQSFGYEFTGGDAEKTFEILAQHGLIEHDDYQTISPLLKPKPSVVNHYNLRKNRAVGYDQSTGKSITAAKSLTLR